MTTETKIEKLTPTRWAREHGEKFVKALPFLNDGQRVLLEDAIKHHNRAKVLAAQADDLMTMAVQYMQVIAAKLEAFIQHKEDQGFSMEDGR